MPARLLAIGVALTWLATGPARAQTSDAPNRLTVTATRVDKGPTIDGRLDDAAWRAASRIVRFVQQTPVEGAPASELTEVYVAYDSEYLYFGIYAHYSKPDLIRANRVERDKTENDDTVSVFLEPFLDQQRGFGFSVNGYGVQADALLTAGALGTSFDLSWNALYHSASAIVEDGWTAEMAIPVKSLRYPGRGPDQPHQWGLQVQRIVQSKNETAHWSPVSSNVIGQLAQMGIVDGIQNLSTSRNLEIMPSLTGIQVDAGQGDARVTDRMADVGVNVKYGLTSNLTFDATFNPDFSQIESDRPQIVANLRFPISFPELRPFFLEGQELFRLQTPVTAVHTRTIVDPRFGAKLSGKIGKTALAVLVANDEAPGKVADLADPAYGKSAMFVAGRLRQDLYSDAFVGALFTNREFLDSHSRLTAVDGTFPFGGRYVSQVKALFTDHRDMAGISRTGHFIDLMTRRQGRSLEWLLASNHASPDFRTDGGFVRRADHHRGVVWLSYRWWPESWVINWGPRLEYERTHSYSDGVLEDEIRTMGVNAQFAKNVSASVTLNKNKERFGDTLFDKTRLSLFTSVATSRRVSFTLRVSRGDEIRFVATPYLGRSTTYSASLTLRPSSRLQSRISLNTNRLVDVRTDSEAFNVKILHALTTYQFTERLLVRNILELNTLNRTLGGNLLLTYRVNAGTVFFAGYDDRYRQNDRFDAEALSSSIYRRTNRAVFTKLQYLFRR